MKTYGVVLAGGPNERLQPGVPAYLKPMLTSTNGGESLVRRITRQFQPLCDQIVVVGSDGNRFQLGEAVRGLSAVDTILHTEHRVGGALLAGLERIDAEDGRVILLMGDNYVSASDLAVFTTWFDRLSGYYPVAVRWLPNAEARRFTRRRHGRWYEGRELHSDETRDVTDDGACMVWCGPVTFDLRTARGVLRKIIETTPNGRAVYVGPLLNELLPPNREYAQVLLQVLDVGTPDALVEFYEISSRNDK